VKTPWNIVWPAAGLLGWLVAVAAALHSEGPGAWPRYGLHPDRVWMLNAPGHAQFDVSGLLRTRDGRLLAISDMRPTLYRIVFGPSDTTGRVVRVPGSFPFRKVMAFGPPLEGKYDCEGLAQDDQGRFYLCEERHRWILRWDPAHGRVDRLEIDWSPVKKFFSADPNASFEGVAVGDGRLYVANERQSPRIIVVDLATLEVVDDFEVRPKAPSLFGLLHYSDLAWWRGRLYVLCRQRRAVLAVSPTTHAVLAEYDYRAAEKHLGYATQWPAGIMEGLAVDASGLWLGTDNNGEGHAQAPRDRRPTLLHCKWPMGRTGKEPRRLSDAAAGRGDPDASRNTAEKSAPTPSASHAPVK